MMQRDPLQPVPSGAPPGEPGVLIVGAGPIGMVLAAELLQQGVAVRLIDKAEAVPENDPHSRAILVLPRTLELLRRIGVSERLIAVGRKVPAIRYYSDGRPLGTARLDRLPDTPYPFMLALPQRETERVLQRRLYELGGTIERGVALEAVAAVDRPRALLRHSEGSVEELAPGWLVGADGAASTTRELLGTKLGGDPTDVTYVIADAPISGTPSSDAHYFYSRHGLVAVVPMRNGLYRIAGNVPHRPDEREPSWRELLQDLVGRRARLQLLVGEPTYARMVRPRCGVAATFRSGRCFLVGDAAHVITPAGGQGMNLGIQDSVNLAWKLGGVLRQELSEEILDTYEAERRAAVTRTSAVTARIVRLAQQRTKSRVLLRNGAFVLADRAGLVQRVLAPLLSQLDVDYGDRTTGRRGWGNALRAGRRVPLFAAAPSDSATPAGPALDPEAHTVVLWPGRHVPPDWEATQQRIRRRVDEAARVLDLASVSPSLGSALRHGLGPRPGIVIVRPDGHVAHVAGLEQYDAAAQFLRATAPAHRVGPRVAGGADEHELPGASTVHPRTPQTTEARQCVP